MSESVENSFGPLLTTASTKALIQLFYLLIPIQPQRHVQKLMLNICLHAESRDVFLSSFAALLNDDKQRVLKIINSLGGTEDQPQSVVDFPPNTLIGASPEVVEDVSPNNRHAPMFQRRPEGNSSATVAASLPASVRGSSHDKTIPPAVARRIIGLLSTLSKSSSRICVSVIESVHEISCLEQLLDLLDKSLYSRSATNLEQLLTLLEIAVTPLSLLPKDDQEIDLTSEKTSSGKEWVKVPRVEVSKRRLNLLVNTLRLESCKDASFVKVNTISRRLSRVAANRECIMNELASVAQSLSSDAIRDLKSVSFRLSKFAWC
jgi:hypothetical protein